MRVGQADRQFDQPQGRRGAVPRPGAPRCALRRRRGRHGVRRDRPGRHQGAQGRDLQARLQAADRRRLPGRGHHLRSQHLRHRHRASTSTAAMRSTSSRRRGEIRARCPARPYLGRPVEPQLLVPRQRAGAPGDALGLPLPRHPRRAGHGDRQRRPARRLRRDRPGAARGLRGRHPRPPPEATPPSGWSRSPSASRTSIRSARSRPRNGAAGRSRSGSRMRWSRASTPISSRTPRKRGSCSRGRSRSSRGR